MKHTVATISSTALLLLSLVLPTTAVAAAPKDKDKDRKKLGATWEVTRAGTVIGKEKLKLVVKADGRRFLSVVFTPAGKKAKRAADRVYPLNAVLWRDGAGQLTKYMRVQDKRLGVGVRVFRRGKAAKIVGINARKDMSSVPLTDHVIVDARVWGSLWDWLPRIRSSQVDQTVQFISVVKRTGGKALVHRGEPVALTTKRGAAATVTPWTISGVGIKGLTLYVDSKHRLVGARSESRAMLLKGWSWEAPPAPSDEVVPPADKPAPAAAPKTDATPKPAGAAKTDGATDTP